MPSNQSYVLLNGLILYAVVIIKQFGDAEVTIGGGHLWPNVSLDYKVG